jgi:hypothetical protein
MNQGELAKTKNPPAMVGEAQDFSIGQLLFGKFCILPTELNPDLRISSTSKHMFITSMHGK